VEESLIRFLLGGAIVSVFAVLGDLFMPKSFAGLFGAAPSVALATLALAIAKEGEHYAATEARSMIAGAIALCVYSQCVSYVMMRRKLHALLVTCSAISLWLAAAFGLWAAFLR
jgi:uncharacterized membrane protein (GlpM family)